MLILTEGPKNPTGGRFLEVEPPRRNEVLLCPTKEVHEKNLKGQRPILGAPRESWAVKRDHLITQGKGCWIIV